MLFHAYLFFNAVFHPGVIYRAKFPSFLELFLVCLVYKFLLIPAFMMLKRQDNRHPEGIGYEILKYTNTFAYKGLPGILESISTNAFRKSHEGTKGTE